VRDQRGDCHHQAGAGRGSSYRTAHVGAETTRASARRNSRDRARPKTSGGVVALGFAEMRASRLPACLRWAAAISVASAAGRAGADDARDPVPVRLEFTGPVGCPTPDEFARRVEERAPHMRRAADGERARAFRAVVRAGPSGAVGRLVLVEPDGRTSERSLEAGDCRQAMEALALITALAVERPADAEPAPPESSRPAPETAPPAPAAPTPATASAPAPAHEASAAPPARAPAPESRTAPREAPPAAASGQTAAPRARAVWTFDGAVEGFGAAGLTPGPTAGGAILVGVAETRPGSVWSPSLRLGAAIILERSFREAGGVATFGWVAGVGELCPLAVAVSGGVRITPCVAGEYGAMHARGTDTIAPATVRRPWAAAGAAVRLSVRVAGPLRAEAAVEALAVIDRDRFFLGGAEVFVVPPVYGRLVAGVGF
jgi:hypothetical protein